MKIEDRNEAGVTIVTLTGELDTDTLEETRAFIDGRIDAGAAKLCINLGGLKFINSSSIGYFVALHKRLNNEGGTLVLSQPSDFLHTAISTLGLDQLFAIFANDEDALKHFAGEGTETVTSDAPVDPTMLGSTEMQFALAGGDGPQATARILHLWKDGISFKYPDAGVAGDVDPEQLGFGTKLSVTFQQPFIDRNHLFRIEGEIAYSLDQEDGSVKHHLRYTQIADDDLKKIEDFVATKDQVLAYLPREE